MLKIGEELKEEIKKIIKETTKEKILWSGSSNTAITLSDSILNYEYIIVYFEALQRKWSIQINSLGLWPFTVNAVGYFDGSYMLRLQGVSFTVTDKSITPATVGSSYVGDIKVGNTVQFRDNVGNAIIKKVVGYNKIN